MTKSGITQSTLVLLIIGLDHRHQGEQGVSKRPTESPITRPIARNIGEDHFMADRHLS
jgi:hypothetical protein